jgi:hypothetical protein
MRSAPARPCRDALRKVVNCPQPLETTIATSDPSTRQIAEAHPRPCDISLTSRRWVTLIAKAGDDTGHRIRRRPSLQTDHWLTSQVPTHQGHYGATRGLILGRVATTEHIGGGWANRSGSSEYDGSNILPGRLPGTDGGLSMAERVRP